MKQIKMLVKDIKEELCGAEKYAKRYVEYKDTDREVSGMYRAMAEQELGHVNSLHSQAVRMIREYQSQGNEVPAAMQAVWDWEHEQMIEQTAEIKLMLSM